MFSRVKGQEREVVDWSQQGPYLTNRPEYGTIWVGIQMRESKDLKKKRVGLASVPEGH